MSLHACGGFAGSSRLENLHPSGLQGPPGALQGPPEASRGLQGAPGGSGASGVSGDSKSPKNLILNEKCAGACLQQGVEGFKGI